MDVKLVRTRLGLNLGDFGTKDLGPGLEKILKFRVSTHFDVWLPIDRARAGASLILECAYVSVIQ